MKLYKILTIVSGCLLGASCKKSGSTTAQDLQDIGLAPGPVAEAADTHAANKANQEQATRKIWPPASDNPVNDLLTENFLVVLDDSGSMSGSKMKQAKQALKALADTLDEKHQLGLMLLNDEKVIPIGSNNREEFKTAVSRTSADGGTPLTKATKRAFTQITEQASRQQGYGAYHIIIVTDGESGDGTPMKIVKAIVKNTAVQVHVVGFHVDTHGMNDPAYVDYQTAKNTAELIKAFEAVAAETNEFSDPQEFTK